MLLSEVRAAASQIWSPVVAAVRMASRPGDAARAGANGLAHIAVRGVHLPGSEQRGAQLVRALEQLPGVNWAEINAAMGHVVVNHDPEVVEVAELISMAREFESASGLSDEPYADADAVHPANPVHALGDALLMGANLLGLGVAAVTQALPVPALPDSVPAVLVTADSAPAIRGPVESRLGRTWTDLLFGMAETVAHALAQQPTALLTGSVMRWCLLREHQAAHRSWIRWDAEFGAQRERHRSAPRATGKRPMPLPAGPVERVGQGAAMVAPTAFAAALGMTGSPSRAQGFLVAVAPRPAHLGREAFAAQIGQALCNRDNLVLDSVVLRKLDRIDTVVIDEAVLRTGGRTVQNVLPLSAGVESGQLWELSYDLVIRGVSNEDWSAEPIGGSSQETDPWRARGGEVPAPGAQRYVLNRHSEAVAVFDVVDELDPLTDQLLAAAHAVGTVRLAGHRNRLADRLGVKAVDGGTRLENSVRELQAEHRGVVVVSAQQSAGLATADLGIGHIREEVPPWGANILCGPSLGESCALLGLMPLARKVSVRSAQLAVATSAAGTLFTLLGTARRTQERAEIAVVAGAVFALVAGTWWGMRGARRPVPHAAPRTPWHNMSPSHVLELLDSSSDGLSEDEAQRRAEETEELSERRRLGLSRATLSELEGPLTPALAGGAAISAGIGAVTDAVVILAVLGLNALIGGAQRFSADRALVRLVQTAAIPVSLRRRGISASASAEELVSGDVVELVAGDSVPADCRVLEADGLEVDESSLTGESQLVCKTETATPAVAVADRRSMLYQGTAVAVGRAVAVVVATGPDTEARRAVTTSEGPSRTGGVAARLRALAAVAVPMCVGAGGVLLVADLLRRRPLGVALGRAVSLAVAAVPEGLPFVATVAETAAARRLSQRGALVHNASTIEALGRAQVLCFDKTGTLTEGRIALRYVSDGVTSLALDDLCEAHRNVLSAALRASPAGENGEALPHPTDRAVVEGARQAAVQATTAIPGWHRIEELPFEPSRSYHAVLGASPEGQLLSVKGAPEVVVAQCAYQNVEGKLHRLDDANRKSILDEMDRLARSGFRVLAVAERPASDRRDLDESRIRDLHFTGMIALADTVRSTAAQAVDQLQQAGVQIVVVTGDHPSTAEAIAADIDVLNSQRVMTGPELDALDDTQLADEVAGVAVFARVTPEQKVRIVQALRSRDRIVAVTGDGANDAPAIRLADIGIALGERATPAAREAADLVVTDDRIETIVDAIVEGRGMWASVRDSLAILLGGNLGEIGYTVLTGLISTQGGMNARQLLLVNVLTDVLPAMAIAVRPPPQLTAQMLLAEGPEASLGTALTQDIYRRGAITAGAATAAWLLGRMTGTARQASTVALVALVGSQLGQTMVIRGRTLLVVGSALISLGVLAVVVQAPGLSHFFGSTPLPPHSWAIAAGVTLAAVLISMWGALPRRD